MLEVGTVLHTYIFYGASIVLPAGVFLTLWGSLSQRLWPQRHHMFLEYWESLLRIWWGDIPSTSDPAACTSSTCRFSFLHSSLVESNGDKFLECFGFVWVENRVWMRGVVAEACSPLFRTLSSHDPCDW